LRLLYSYQYAHPGKKLLFMGQEFAQRQEWSEARSLDWHLLQHESHRGVQRLVADLNRIYASEPALHEVDFEWTGFEWIDANDGDNSVLTFLRRGKTPGDFVVAILNATPVPRSSYRIGVPEAGAYREVFNSDAGRYGGSNMGNMGEVRAAPIRHMGRPYSVELTLPPLAAIYLKWSKP
jgi:1,4-alpha-glucan branching enzyme